MKSSLTSFVLFAVSLTLAAAELSPEDRLTSQALAKLDKKMGAAFTIPFPAKWDIDVYLKQPIAVIAVDGGKVSATKPQINPYSGETIEWMMGAENPDELSKENIICMVSLDEDGQCSQIGLLSHPDSWPAEGREGHQLWRRDGELGTEFFTRAMLTYRLRSKKAKDPAQALRYLAAFEKIVTATIELRKLETQPAHAR